MKFFEDNSQEGSHSPHSNKNGKGNHSPMKHMLHMILCCALPIIVLFSIPFISKISPGSDRALTFIAPLICPIMMFAMIPMMFGGKKVSSEKANTEETN